MDFNFSNYDLHVTEPMVGESSPSKFLKIDPRNTLQLPQDFFTLGADYGSKGNHYSECYDKQDRKFSELSEEVEEVLSGYFDPNVSDIKLPKEQFMKAGNRSSLNLYDVKNIHPQSKFPENPKVDQVSMTSQCSDPSPRSHDSERSESEAKESCCNSSKYRSSGANSTHMNLTKWSSGEANGENSNKKHDEENLVFLIRKVDRKTKKSRLLTRHRKRITKCPHKGQEYYAKGMCKNCYHNKGTRSKKATKCKHKDRDHYAKGLCKSCYLHFFHIKKKARRASEVTSDSAKSN